MKTKVNITIWTFPTGAKPVIDRLKRITERPNSAWEFVVEEKYVGTKTTKAEFQAATNNATTFPQFIVNGTPLGGLTEFKAYIKDKK